MFAGQTPLLYQPGCGSNVKRSSSGVCNMSADGRVHPNTLMDPQAGGTPGMEQAPAPSASASDPVVPTGGKPTVVDVRPPATYLEWQNLGYKVPAIVKAGVCCVGREWADKQILTDVSGFAGPGAAPRTAVADPRAGLTVIMGPSGGGKTSLLNALSGRAACTGSIRVNGVPWRE